MKPNHPLLSALSLAALLAHGISALADDKAQQQELGNASRFFQQQLPGEAGQQATSSGGQQQGAVASQGATTETGVVYVPSAYSYSGSVGGSVGP